MPRPTFADPKTDFIFKRIFGSEPHKHLLIRLLNTLLELDEGRLITDLSYLAPEQKVPLPEMKLSVVDVKCVDQRGVRYVVEMQLFNVQGFEERVVYNAAKAITLQLGTGEDYHKLQGVVGVTICDFSLWPDPPAEDSPEGGPTKAGPAVPMLSRWRMQEQHTGVAGLAQVQYVFLELPKYTAGPHPTELVDKWVLFFREAENLEVIPPELDEEPFREAFEIARMAQLSAAEYEAYEQSKMAEQDARGALGLARAEGEAVGEARGRAEGEARGRAEGKAASLLAVLEARGLTPNEELRRRILATADLAVLERWLRRAVVVDSADEVFAGD